MTLSDQAWNIAGITRKKQSNRLVGPVELGERSVPHGNGNTDYVGHENEAFE